MKVAICLPSHSVNHALFTHCLGAMIARTVRERPDIELLPISVQGTLPRVRNRLFRDAVKADAAYSLWHDNDHVFPDWALLRLLSLNLQVVGINQPTRSLSPVPTARNEAGDRIYTTPAQWAEREIERVRYMGFGICLIDMSIVTVLEEHAKAQRRRSIYPLFSQLMTPDPDQIVGEDTFFCDAMAEAGIPLHIDHCLSWETRHLATIPISMADALEKRPA
jgi:hypothetical protein